MPFRSSSAFLVERNKSQKLVKCVSKQNFRKNKVPFILVEMQVCYFLDKAHCL